jgi:uncharacterized Ntn-hydrolase superfamily protein
MRTFHAVIGLTAFSIALSLIDPKPVRPDPLVSTFSIVAVDLENGDVGVAVQSKFPNVRPVVPWAKAGVGAVATQSFANTSFGPRGISLMENGATAEEAMRILIATDSARQSRQVGIIDRFGNAASWTGLECFDWAGGVAGSTWGKPGEIVVGKGFAAQGNILVGRPTVEAMARTFESTNGSRRAICRTPCQTGRRFLRRHNRRLHRHFHL